MAFHMQIKEGSLGVLSVSLPVSGQCTASSVNALSSHNTQSYAMFCPPGALFHTSFSYHSASCNNNPNPGSLSCYVMLQVADGVAAVTSASVIQSHAAVKAVLAQVDLYYRKHCCCHNGFCRICKLKQGNHTQNRWLTQTCLCNRKRHSCHSCSRALRQPLQVQTCPRLQKCWLPCVAA